MANIHCPEPFILVRVAGLELRRMCNEFQLRLNFNADWWNHAGAVDVPIEWRMAAPNRPLNQPFKPTDRAPVLRPIDPGDPAAGLEAVDMRWWLVPFFHKGPTSAWRSMCTNATVETVDTAPSFREPYRRRRALVPITSFIEYDEPPGWKKGKPKRRWEVSWEARGPFDQVRYFAGVWDRASPADYPDGLESMAFITGPPGPDVGQVHDRQPAVLTFDEGMRWLALDGPGKAGLGWRKADAADGSWEVAAPAACGYRVAERPRELEVEA